MTVGAVTGLAAEAALAREIGLEAEVGAGTIESTEAAIAALIRRPVIGLVSFGIAGGLAPNLATGTLLLPAAVRARDGSAYWVDVQWHLRLAKAARDAGIEVVVVGGMLGADAIAASAVEKAALHAQTKAVAVDLESHRVGAAARHARLPFAVLRVIADSAARDLPPAALLPLTRGGQPNLARVLLSAVRHPGQIRDLILLGRETRQALDGLRRAAHALASDLAKP